MFDHASPPNRIMPTRRTNSCQLAEKLILLYNFARSYQFSQGRTSVRKYYPRVADEVLRSKLEAKGAVLIEGPKWCGKSTTATRAARSAVYLQDPSTREQNMMLAKASPKRFLQGDAPKLIDEWQVVPSIWDAVRFEVDQRDEFGQFILTGSVTPPATDEIAHSGTGRITRMRMRPMTLFESGESSGEVSLAALFDGDHEVFGETSLSLEDLAFALCRGGWPKAIGCRESVALAQAVDYYDDLVSTDFSKIDGVRRSRERVSRFLRSYARHSATGATYTTIRADMLANETDSLSEDTISSYVDVMEKLFVIENLPSWHPNLRSKTAIRTSDTRHFVDPSIAAASLGLGPNDLMNDLRTYGLLFESLCVRDLRVYAQRLRGDVYHYRNKRGQEADAVLHLRDGRYALVEAKLFSQEHIDEGARSLLSIRDDIDEEKMGSPSFLMVVTGTPYAYRREDGVLVAPLGTLAP